MARPPSAAIWQFLRTAFLLLSALGAGAIQTFARAEGDLIDRGTLERQLEAQFQASIIRERRLADDRESRLIQDYETKLLQARAVAANGDVGAAAELKRVRGEYAELVQSIAVRDFAARAAVEVYRNEVRGLVADATPERLAALQQFADGDRKGAWPVLEAIRSAEDRAIEASANSRRAALWREDAVLREVMAEHGEATSQDILELWQKAADLDPQVFHPHCRVGDLLIAMGDFEGARVAYDKALEVATEPADRVVGYTQIGDWHAFRGDWIPATENYRQAYVVLAPLIAPGTKPSAEIEWAGTYLMERIASTIPLNDDSQTVLRFKAFLDVLIKRNISVRRAKEVTNMLPHVEVTSEQLDELDKAVFQWASSRAAAADQHPNDSAYLISFVGALSIYTNVLICKGDYESAETYAAEAVRILEEVFDAPSQLAENYWIALALLADSHIALQKLDEAQAAYDRVLDAMRTAAKLDEPNKMKKRNVAVMLQRTGAIALLKNDRAAAKKAWGEAAEITSSLLLIDPSNRILQYDVMTTGLLMSLAADAAE